MLFRRYSPERGYYELLSWRALAAIIFGFSVLAGLALFLYLNRPVQVSAQQQMLLDHLNCLRVREGKEALRPDRALMQRAQEFAELLAESKTDLDEIEAAGGGVVWATTETLSDDPCYQGWFAGLDPESGDHPLVLCEAQKVGLGYAPIPGDPALAVIVWLSDGSCR